MRIIIVEATEAEEVELRAAVAELDHEVEIERMERSAFLHRAPGLRDAVLVAPRDVVEELGRLAPEPDPGAHLAELLRELVMPIMPATTARPPGTGNRAQRRAAARGRVVSADASSLPFLRWPRQTTRGG